MKNWKKTVSLCLVLAMCLALLLSFPVAVSAAGAEDATIDTTRTGSLDIYKYKSKHNPLSRIVLL